MIWPTLDAKRLVLVDGLHLASDLISRRRVHSWRGLEADLVMKDRIGRENLVRRPDWWNECGTQSQHSRIRRMRGKFRQKFYD